jgi:hypothetical protein
VPRLAVMRRHSERGSVVIQGHNGVHQLILAPIR